MTKHTAILILSLLPGFVLAQKTKVACVGDSITYGSTIEDREKFSYPAQLQNLLGEKFEVKNFGVSGTTLLSRGDSPYVKTKEYVAAQAYKPEVVVINLGTNDSKPQNWKHKKHFKKDYQNMINAFKNLPTKPRVYVCLPTPAFPERWGIRDSIIKEETIPMLKELAFEMNLPMIDFYTPLVGKADHFPDKVHPNKIGAAVLARRVSGEIKKSPTPAALKKIKEKKARAAAAAAAG